MRHQSNRAALKTAYQSRYATTSLPPLAAMGHVVSSSSIRTLQAAILADFSLQHGKEIFSGDRHRSHSDFRYSDIATFIRAMTGATNAEGGLLGLGIFSLLTQYMGTFRKDAGLKQVATQSYGAVLRHFNTSIGHLRNGQKISGGSIAKAFALCVALHYHEVPRVEQILERARSLTSRLDDCPAVFEPKTRSSS